MRLSTRSRYGLRILVQIALECRELECVRGRVVAEKQGISEAYLEQILIPLKTAGFVRTLRGRNGGYAMNCTPEEITVLDVIELFEGKVELAECVQDGEVCERASFCPTTEVWQRLAKAFRAEAATINLGELVEKMDRFEHMQSVDYII